MFTISQRQNPPQLIWVPVEPAEVIYHGSIVGVDTTTPLEGIQPLPVAAGASNTTNQDIPFGIVVGTNVIAQNETYSTTYNVPYATQVAAGSVYGNTTSYRGVEGPWPKGDPQLMALIELITPSTVIRGPIYNAAVGTAPTVVTVTTASGGDGIGFSTGASDVATVANFATAYMRSGANRGVYRTLTSASTIDHTHLKAFKFDVALGDTAVIINGLRPYGPAKMQIDSEAQYIDCNAALTADYFNIIVHRLDLSEAGNEYVEFRFDADNFCAARA